VLKAIIFDCDGVIVNSEPHHFLAFQLTLAGEGIPLSREEYYKTYLAMDDKGCFEAVLSAHGRPFDKPLLKRLIHQKMALYKTFSEKELYLYPGVTDFVRSVAGHYRLAVASGAFRGEIKFALDTAGIRSAFPVIVSAQDVKRGKPHPEAFLTALDRLNHLYQTPLIQPSECVVIEDSIHGLEAAHEAKMKSVAVTNSYPKEQVEKIADWVVDSLLDLTRDEVEALCKTN
jgi:HAD superfamily hydrolase (TIGR01509 family)